MFKCFVFWSIQKRQTSRSEYIYFEVYKFYQICYFCVAHNINYFIIKFCTLVDYIFKYVQIYFHNFLRNINMILIFFKWPGSLEPRSQKYFPFHVYILNYISFLWASLTDASRRASPKDYSPNLAVDLTGISKSHSQNSSVPFFKISYLSHAQTP
jgi:hypothetical protein